MTLENFIPEIWSARLLSNLQTKLVYGALANTDYEGEIKSGGDTVHINNIGRITVGTYTKNTDISAAETLTDATQALVIDQQNYFNFQVDDVDKVQQKPKVMDEAMKEAAYALKNTIDKDVAAVMSAGVAAGNIVGTSASDDIAIRPGTAADWPMAYEAMVDMGVLLDVADCPEDERFIVIPPWMHGIMLKDPRFVSYGTDKNRETLAAGSIGEAAGFTVYKSNNCPGTGGPPVTSLWQVVAGHKNATSFAHQIASTEAYRPQLRFGDAVKGLQVYGRKVVRPTFLAKTLFSKS